MGCHQGFTEEGCQGFSVFTLSFFGISAHLIVLDEGYFQLECSAILAPNQSTYPFLPSNTTLQQPPSCLDDFHLRLLYLSKIYTTVAVSTPECQDADNLGCH